MRKFNKGDKVKTITNYPGIGNHVKGTIIKASVSQYWSSKKTYLCRIETDDKKERVINQDYLELDKEYYRNQKINTILKK